MLEWENEMASEIDEELDESLLSGDARRYDDYADLEEEEFLDIIEVYDETGELIATYDAIEYAKLKAAK